MTDHFAVLRSPRRPWLDPDQLKQEYHQRTLASHPDRKKSDHSEDSDFAAVTEAYRVLSSPRLRLQHLLSFESDVNSIAEADQVTADLSDVFMNAAVLAGDVDDFLRKREQRTSALATSLLQSHLSELRTRTDTILQQLQELHGRAVEELRQADELWMSDPGKTLGELRRLARRFAFLGRWIDQLREKEFQLSS